MIAESFKLSTSLLRTMPAKYFADLSAGVIVALIVLLFATTSVSVRSLLPSTPGLSLGWHPTAKSVASAMLKIENSFLID